MSLSVYTSASHPAYNYLCLLLLQGFGRPWGGVLALQAIRLCHMHCSGCPPQAAAHAAPHVAADAADVAAEAANC